MVANGGRDCFNGGAGVDTVTFANSTTSVMVLLGSGLGYGGYAEGATFTGIEDVQGSAYSDYLVGDAGDNSLFGNEGNDYLSGGEGNNVLFGGNGDDYLTAGSGADYVSGGDGNDSLTGGWGNDRLSGGAGNDHYYFGRNYANDNVFDYDSIVGNTDAAHFGSDIAADQIWFRHVGNNLEASIIGTSDTLTIQNWYSGSAYHVEQFRTVDGHVLTDSQVESLVQAMAGFAPPASGQTTLPTNYQTALQPIIAANWQ
jgi:Ca2+-binding RTX toxin-like protein